MKPFFSHPYCLLNKLSGGSFKSFGRADQWKLLQTAATEPLQIQISSVIHVNANANTANLSIVSIYLNLSYMQWCNGNYGAGSTERLYLVQPACEIDDNFSGSVVINDLKLTNVTWRYKWQISLSKTLTSNYYLFNLKSLVSRIWSDGFTKLHGHYHSSARCWPYVLPNIHSFVTCISIQLYDRTYIDSTKALPLSHYQNY